MAHWHNLGVLTMAGIITLSPWVPTYRTTKGKIEPKVKYVRLYPPLNILELNNFIRQCKIVP